jgi:hypothetical protein
VFCEVGKRTKFVQRIGDSFSEVTCPALNAMQPEAACGSGELVFQNGYFHDGMTTNDGINFGQKVAVHAHTRFYRCRCPECCQVDAVSGDTACANGTHGILCASCKPDHYLDFTSDLCIQCTESDRNATPMLIAGSVVLFCAIASLICQHRQLARFARLFNDAKRRVVPKMKLIISFYQIICLFGDVYNIPYPPEYLALLRLLKVFNFEFLTVARVAW